MNIKMLRCFWGDRQITFQIKGLERIVFGSPELAHPLQ